jgi:hypothetical protein
VLQLRRPVRLLVFVNAVRLIYPDSRIRTIPPSAEPTLPLLLKVLKPVRLKPRTFTIRLSKTHIKKLTIPG